MKKFLAILLSAALCATVAYSAYAANSTEEETNDVTTTDTSKSVEDVVNALKNDEQAQKIADGIVDAIKTGATKDDITDLVGSLGDYVSNAGFDLSDLKDGGAVRDVLDMFLADSGIDSEELNNAISESTIANGILNLYYSTPDVTTTTTTTAADSVIIPDTGFIG